MIHQKNLSSTRFKNHRKKCKKISRIVKIYCFIYKRAFNIRIVKLTAEGGTWGGKENGNN
jgi:hypothetical protein